MRRIEYRGVTLEEMDVDAVIARHPAIAIVDELAHTNVPGSKNRKRYQDVLDLLNAGISVITAVNIQHLESLNDVVTRTTGVRVRETVPDHFPAACGRSGQCRCVCGHTAHPFTTGKDLRRRKDRAGPQ